MRIRLSLSVPRPSTGHGITTGPTAIPHIGSGTVSVAGAPASHSQPMGGREVGGGDIADVAASRCAALVRWRETRFLLGAGGGARTHTTLPSRDFKSLASTSSATSALVTRSET